MDNNTENNTENNENLQETAGDANITGENTPEISAAAADLPGTTESTGNVEEEAAVYEDPNKGIEPVAAESYVSGTGNNDSYGYHTAGEQHQQSQQNQQNQQSQPGQNGQARNYQENYNYNVGTNTGYHTTYDSGMDNTPMTMGDWLLTLLVMTLLPCVGIPLYFVWAFGKSGNINRRNFCRAYLIVIGIGLVIAVIFGIIIGFSALGSLRYYY